MILHQANQEEVYYIVYFIILTRWHGEIGRAARKSVLTLSPGLRGGKTARWERDG